MLHVLASPQEDKQLSSSKMYPLFSFSFLFLSFFLLLKLLFVRDRAVFG